MADTRQDEFSTGESLIPRPVETNLGTTISRYGRPVIAEEVPALEFIDAEVRAAVDVQQRRGESLHLALTGLLLAVTATAVAAAQSLGASYGVG